MSTIFADDTKLYKKITCPEDADYMQKDIDSFYDWCTVWWMSFNITKCFIMHYGKTNNEYIYHINGNILSKCDTYKDLGVLTSNDLKVHAQLKSCVAKANSIVGMIRRTFTFIDGDLLTRTFKIFVRPILEYCQQVWCPYLSKDIEELERVQRRATKLVPYLKDLDYEERLAKLNLMSLEDRRKRGDLIYMFKLMKGIIDVDYRKFFTLSRDANSNYMLLRGHQYHVKQQENCNGDKRLNFFTIRIINPWNELPAEVVNSKSINEFKSNYDRIVLKIKPAL